MPTVASSEYRAAREIFTLVRSFLNDAKANDDVHIELRNFSKEHKVKRRLSIIAVGTLLILAVVILSYRLDGQGGNFGSVYTGLTWANPQLTLGSAGNGNAILALAGTTSGQATLTAPAVAGTITNPIVASNSISIPAGAYIASGNKVFVTTDFTDANSAALQAITGLTYSLGTAAQNWSFHCGLFFSQATPVAGDQFGVAVLTTAPTNVNAAAIVGTNVTTYGSTTPLTGLATTTPTALVTFTEVPTTVEPAFIDGTIEAAGGGAQTFQLYVLNGTAANVIVIKRGSYCTLY